MRNISDQMDEQIENLSKGNQWDEMVRDMQTAGRATSVTEAFVAIEKAFGDVEAEVVELLQEEQLGLPQRPGRDHSVDVTSLWSAKPLDEKSAKGKRAFQTGVTGIRGVQSGMYMFSSIGSWLPDRGRRAPRRQPGADRRRRAVRQHAAARRAQEEGDGAPPDRPASRSASSSTTCSSRWATRSRAMVREGQRDLRDEFTDRLGELQRTYTETAQRAQADVQKTQQERQQRAAEGAKALAVLDAIDQQVGLTGDGTHRRRGSERRPIRSSR